MNPTTASMLNQTIEADRRRELDMARRRHEATARPAEQRRPHRSWLGILRRPRLALIGSKS
jgi:hypothetical protein